MLSSLFSGPCAHTASILYLRLHRWHAVTVTKGIYVRLPRGHAITRTKSRLFGPSRSNATCFHALPSGALLLVLPPRTPPDPKAEHKSRPIDASLSVLPSTLCRVPSNKSGCNAAVNGEREKTNGRGEHRSREFGAHDSVPKLQKCILMNNMPEPTTSFDGRS